MFDVSRVSTTSSGLYAYHALVWIATLEVGESRQVFTGTLYLLGAVDHIDEIISVLLVSWLSRGSLGGLFGLPLGEKVVVINEKDGTVAIVALGGCNRTSLAWTISHHTTESVTYCVNVHLRMQPF